MKRQAPVWEKIIAKHMPLYSQSSPETEPMGVRRGREKRKFIVIIDSCGYGGQEVPPKLETRKVTRITQSESEGPRTRSPSVLSRRRGTSQLKKRENPPFLCLSVLSGPSADWRMPGLLWRGYRIFSTKSLDSNANLF